MENPNSFILEMPRMMYSIIGPESYAWPIKLPLMPASQFMQEI